MTSLDTRTGAGPDGDGVDRINNRDLTTITTDLATTDSLMAALAERTAARREPLLVSESGLHSRGDLDRVVESRC